MLHRIQVQLLQQKNTGFKQIIIMEVQEIGETGGGTAATSRT
jgi:hypothetical protein